MTSVSSDLEDYRPALEGLGYRMLGDWANAQDMAQEAFLKWYALPEPEREKILKPKAWLLKVVSRLAIDRMKSARYSRESYVGPWLPEPWLVEEQSPADQAEVDESVTLALMLALERLSPSERAVFILREVFALGFEEIGEAVGKSAVACRKLFSRARDSVRQGKPRYEMNHARHERLLRAFSEASGRGDLDGLKSMLAEDVAVHSDSGGLVPAARRVLRDPDKVARFFIGVTGKARARGVELRTEVRVVNGLPALVMRAGESVQTLLAFSIAEGRIHAVFVQRNPGKLKILECLWRPDRADACH